MIALRSSASSRRVMRGKTFLATPRKIWCASRVERMRTFCIVGTCIVAKTTARGRWGGRPGGAGWQLKASPYKLYTVMFAGSKRTADFINFNFLTGCGIFGDRDAHNPGSHNHFTLETRGEMVCRVKAASIFGNYTWHHRKVKKNQS
jgi:hypothetical protein